MTTSIDHTSDTKLKKNKVLLLAAGIAAFTSLLHIIGGGASVATPLIESSLAEEPRLTSFAVWHMVSITLSFSAIALYVGALPKHAERARYMVVFVSALWVGFGAVFLVVAATQEGDGLFLKLPQWILALPVGFLGVWGAFRKPTTAKAAVPSDGSLP